MIGGRWDEGPILVLGAEGMLGRDLVPILRTRLNDPRGERVIAVSAQQNHC